ncbi:hypothetical protein [Chromobacterium vaccinii]|uniref:hypothetical protein n=1 Tax=Chromobacterium vaccinii TaxID=1108595 RepID=UPI001319E551|nr:hypothetical protein [Chromobacterium vaccinii]
MHGIQSADNAQRIAATHSAQAASAPLAGDPIGVRNGSQRGPSSQALEPWRSEKPRGDFISEYRANMPTWFEGNSKLMSHATHQMSMFETLNRASGGVNAVAINQKMSDIRLDLAEIVPGSSMEGMKLIQNGDDIRGRMPYETLSMEGEKYMLHDNEANSRLADGPFCFTIQSSNPNEVRLGARSNGGHTAISRGADVYYAGEMEFQKGSLQFWSNDSGHYKPNPEDREQISRLPVASLFPEDKFKQAQT